MTRKMKGDQKTTGAFNLDAFVQASDPVANPDIPPAKPAKKQARKSAVRPVGRPPIAEDEARDKNVQVKLTKAELAALKEQAGLVPVSTYLRSKLKEFKVI